MAKPINEVGNVYGRLTVIKEIGRKRGAVLFLCHCKCGNDVEETGGDLRTGRVNSCGCLKSEMRIEENTTHGLRKHRLYSIHRGMITRCYYEKSEYFSDYGGRGIVICREWLNSENGFINFYNWAISNGYDETLTLDRINVNGNYEPENCRWATIEQQSLNKRNTRYIIIEGEKKTLKEWCNIFNIKYKTALYRVNNGWDEIKAVTTPAKTKHINKRYVL
jgi:hypothetical protein